MKRILFFLLLIFSQIIYSQIIRKYSNEFLNIGAGARGLAMGGAVISNQDDVYSPMWNPAGLIKPDIGGRIAACFESKSQNEMLHRRVPVHGIEKRITSVIRI